MIVEIAAVRIDALTTTFGIFLLHSTLGRRSRISAHETFKTRAVIFSNNCKTKGRRFEPRWCYFENFYKKKSGGRWKIRG
jgi:hypothetical protein